MPFKDKLKKGGMRYSSKQQPAVNIRWAGSYTYCSLLQDQPHTTEFFHAVTEFFAR